MSLRSPVDQAAIREFLRQLGERYRRPGRLYLVGGTSLVYEGYRSMTLDIDVAIEVQPEDHGQFVGALRELKDRLSINVEEASPGDFIPLPPGYEDRHEYIGRFGQLDIFHFDFYSMALSKIERGQRQDMADVLALLNHGRIAWPALKASFDAIVPLMGQRSIREDPEEFRLNFRTLVEMWRAAGGQT
jgi:hypothetical protein